MRDRPQDPPVLSPFWKAALLLWSVSIFGIVCVMPYVTTLESKVLAQAVERAHLPLWQLLIVSIGQSAVMFAAVIAAGLWASRRIGFTTPIVERILARTPLPPDAGKTLLLALGLGAASGLVLIGLDHFVFAPMPSVAAMLEAANAGGVKTTWWQGLLASFYGGIDEELLMRLGAISLLTLALRRLLGVPAAFWTANLVAAVLFGLGHLPATAALAPLSTALVVRAIVLNGLVGVLTGVLYRRYGLEWGMTAHFGADLVLHVIAG
jgi:hypothetical protein